MKTAAKKAAAKPADVEEQVQGFIDKFDEKNQALIRSVRKALRKRFATAHELVYDNYQFFVIGYSPTERPTDSVLSMTADANGVSIMFPYVGAKMPDPHKLLQGSGGSNRFVRMESAAKLAKPEVVDLIEAAVALRKPLPESGRGKTVIRAVAPKQRSRRK
jgi:hypothetical protein